MDREVWLIRQGIVDDDDDSGSSGITIVLLNKNFVPLLKIP